MSNMPRQQRRASMFGQPQPSDLGAPQGALSYYQGYSEQELLMVLVDMTRIIGEITENSQEALDVQLKQVIQTVTPPTTLSYYTAAATNTATEIKSDEGVLRFLEVQNNNNVDIWLQLFDLRYQSVSIGSTSPAQSWLIPAGFGLYSSREVQLPSQGWNFKNALSYACTTTPAGSGAPTNNLILNALYN